MPQRDAEALWRWITAVYARPGVESAALRLQEERGTDVALLLFACWLGVNGYRLDPGATATLREAGAAWSQGAVRPLRAARRFLRRGTSPVHAALVDQVAALAARAAALELAAERLQLETLDFLATALPRAADPPAAAATAALRDLTGLDPISVPDVKVVLDAALAHGPLTQT